MITKSFLLVLSVGLGASGCVSDSPLLPVGFFSLDPTLKGDCALTAGIQQLGGLLDIGGTQQYQIALQLQSDLDATLDTKVGTSTLVSGKHRNTVILDEVLLTTTSSTTGLTFKPELIPIAGVIAPGDSALIKMNLIGSLALDQLKTALSDKTEVRNIRVKVEFHGTLASGARLGSVPISYPITVVNSHPPDCGVGVGRGRTGPCGDIGGQDGARICCADDPTCVIAK